MRTIIAQNPWHRRAIAFAACFLSLYASAATTKTWELSSFQDFLAGRLEGLSVTVGGRLVLAPESETLYRSDQPEIWSIARAPEGSRDQSIYLGTGDRGRVYQLNENGQATLLWTGPEPEIFALAVASDGTVFAGTSPNGKVYRIRNGQAEEYFAPQASYIWSLVLAPNGDLFVGTGDQGKVYRVTAAGQGEVYYETGQGHVTALALDPQRRLLAGTEPNGILYRIDAQNRAFVLYDSSLPEIRSILIGQDGYIYAAALGGGVSRQATAAYNAATSAAAAATAPTASITVTAQGGIQQPPDPQAPASSATQATTAATVYSPSTSSDYLAERSALYRIDAENRVDTLWTSNRENIYDVAFEGGSLLLLTDAEGRIYRLTPMQVQGQIEGVPQANLVTQTKQGDATRLLATNKGTLAVTGHAGIVFRLGQDPADEGWFESPVHDAGAVSRWGRLSWNTRNGPQANGGVSFRTRTGNSARPDTTWSDWSAEMTNPATIQSPNARYLQWRVDFRGGAARNAAIERVTAAYLPQNTAPAIRSVTVSAVSSSTPSTNSNGGGSGSSIYSISVSASGDVSTSAGTSSETFARPPGQAMLISWQADDPEGDDLLYSLYFRGEDEGQAGWKLLAEDLTSATHTIDGDALADGRYVFRVVVSDRPSNPLDQARAAELVGPPILIDNTPPAVTIRDGRRNGTGFEARVDAVDAASVLRRAEYSVDAGPWTPVEAADGVTDSGQERFDLRISGLAAGNHLITVRVFDWAGNAGLGRINAQ